MVSQDSEPFEMMLRLGRVYPDVVVVTNVCLTLCSGAFVRVLIL